MYASVKKIVKKILPKRLLFKYEFLLRKLISVKYRGKNFQCNVCNFPLKQFITLESKDLLCPACGCRSRSRRLWQLLQPHLLPQTTFLDFSPPRALYRNVKKMPFIKYYASDYANEFVADYKFDITNIDSNSNFFDTISCYHILEHIDDDTKAMAELYRVLKPNGVCFIQTPFKDGAIYEDASITTKTGRLEAFGQDDHVRIYSLEGLQKRLETAGFKIEILKFKEKPNHFNGFRSETVLKAVK